MPDPISAIAGGSSLLGASSASKAAKSQSRAADAQIALQREIYEDTSKKFQPYRQAGNNALAAYLFDMGLTSEAPVFGAKTPQVRTVVTPGEQGTFNPGSGQFTGGTDDVTTYKVGGRSFNDMAAAQAYAKSQATGGTTYGGYTASPEYEWQLSEGLGAVNALAGARGGLNSGATLQALQERGQGLASMDRANYMNRLSGLVDMGMGAAGNQANAGANYASGASNDASGASNALANKGNAQAAGAIGVGNAIQGGISNGLNLWGYQAGLGKSGTGGLAPNLWSAADW